MDLRISGVSRGRGWLNSRVNYLASMGTRRPGSPLQSKNTNIHHLSPGEARIANTNTDNIIIFHCNLECMEHCKELTCRLKLFSDQDDGILFNKKLKYITDYFKQKAKNGSEFRKMFHSLYNTCLHNSDLILKLILIVTVPSMVSIKIHGINLKTELIECLQNEFKGLEDLTKFDPPVFRNIIQMLGECIYRMKDKMACFDDMKMKLLSGLEMLLERAHPLDLRVLNMQLIKNAATLEITPTSLFMIKMRKIFTMQKDLPAESTKRLMLAIDFIFKKSDLLTDEMCQFYTEQLGEKEFKEIQVQVATDMVKGQNIYKYYELPRKVLQVLRAS